MSDSRPRPGTIHVPPCAAVLGDREIEDLVQAVDHALIVPPFSTSITG